MARVLRAVANALPAGVDLGAARVDVRHGWGDILQIRLHATPTGEGDDAGYLAEKVRESVATELGDRRHRLEVVWAPQA